MAITYAFLILGFQIEAEPSPQTTKEVPVLKSGYDLKTESIHTRVTLSFSKTTCRIGDEIEQDIRLEMLKGNGRFHNLRLSSLVSRSAILAVFDEKGKYIGDRLRFRTGKAVFPIAKRSEVESGSYVGQHGVYRPGLAPPPFYGPTLPKLEPGIYKFQLIFLRRFIEFDKRKPVEEQEEELFRSNIVELKLLPRDTIVPKPGYDLKNNSVHGRVTLKANKKECRVDETIELDIRLEILRGGARFHNVKLLPLSPRSAILAVFDDEGTYIGDALGYRLNKRAVPRPKWTELYTGPGTYHGPRLYFRPGLGPPQNLNTGPTLPKLEPGQYQLQLIYLRRFIDFHDGISRDQQEQELFRSNIMKLKVLPKHAKKGECNRASPKR